MEGCLVAGAGAVVAMDGDQLSAGIPDLMASMVIN